MSPLWVSYRSMTSRFPPFAFVELVSPYNKKNITRWLEDMNFMFEWQEQYLTRSLRSLVRYCSCHSNIKFISPRHRVISSIYADSASLERKLHNNFLIVAIDLLNSFVRTESSCITSHPPVPTRLPLPLTLPTVLLFRKATQLHSENTKALGARI